MEFLQQALDDPDPQPCGRCSVCTGAVPAPGARARGPSRQRGGTSAVKMWYRAAQDVAGGLPDRKGKIRLCARTSPGLRRRSGLGRCAAALGQRDGPAPPSIMDGLVDVLRTLVEELGAAGRGGRMPSRRYPNWCLRGRTHCGGWPAAAGPRAHDKRAAAGGRGSLGRTGKDLLARTSVRDGVRFDGPVLLVDDLVRTRWTITVATALLVDAGATQVLPLAIALPKRASRG